MAKGAGTRTHSRSHPAGDRATPSATREVIERAPRERLNGRERLEQPTVTYPPDTRFVIKHLTRNLYLRRYAAVSMTEEEKWKPLEWADSFLGRPEKYAKRMLGHNNFKIVPREE